MIVGYDEAADFMKEHWSVLTSDQMVDEDCYPFFIGFPSERTWYELLDENGITPDDRRREKEVLWNPGNNAEWKFFEGFFDEEFFDMIF